MLPRQRGGLRQVSDAGHEPAVPQCGRQQRHGLDLGTQYTLDLFERFQLSDDELFSCFDHAASKGLVPLCTPWDEASLEKLDRWGMEGFKVASADFTNHALLTSLAATGKPLICSTGMASEVEIRSGIRHLQRRCRLRTTPLHSTYPTPFKDVNLRYQRCATWLRPRWATGS